VTQGLTDLTSLPLLHGRRRTASRSSALRALHVFLREADKTQHWCGLQKVVTNDGNILWLCAEHARFHGI
jgi:hypothetical protein